MRELRCVLVFASLTTSSACIFDSADGDPSGPLGGSRSVSGMVVDFESDQPIAGGASVSASGLQPAPMITSQGASFTIKGVPDNSAFQILASAQGHAPTFSAAVIVGTDDLEGVRAPLVREAFIAGLADGFQITRTAGRGVLLARVVDDRGMPRAGVAASSFALTDASVTGPFFLGEDLQPLPAATATSSSGWIVYFEVAPGVAELGQAATATVTLDMPVSPINAGAITIAEIRALDGAPVLPTNVSFRNQIIPIFRSLAEGGRGCVACHSGGGVGKDLGGLMLDAGDNLTYRELREEDPSRVQLATPERSELLTLPSRESPPDRHPNVTFTSPLDPDYLKILVWIKEGAKDN